MKICFIPIDNRPVCYGLPKDIAKISNDIEFYIPPRELLGDLTKYANTEAIIDWMKNLPEDVNCMIISLDTLAYGGLIPSRRIPDSYEKIKSRIEKIKPIIKGKNVYAFSSIMRISNNNCNDEEKEYWNLWGKKIFEFSYNSCKFKTAQPTEVPIEILHDYMETRKRNFAINALYLDWQKEGLFNTLIFSKDDCAQYGFNVSEAVMLENWGAITKTGADEIPLMLLARAISDDVKIYPIFLEPEYVDLVSNYEDVSVKDSVTGQLNLGNFKVTNQKEDADIVLIINNFKEKQGELVMGIDTEPYKWGFKHPRKPFAVADIRYANGSDNNFVEELFKYPLPPEYGYAGWNTTANTLGSLLSALKVKYHAINTNNYNDIAYKRLQAVRLLDDWGYQANVRKKIESPCDISDSMRIYEERISRMLGMNIRANYTFPWNRKFETEITLY